MKYFVIFSLLAAAAVSVQASSPLVEQAENAQNVIDRTFSRMEYSWSKMKEHFSLGSDKIREQADKAAKKTIQSGKELRQKLPGGGR